MVTRARRSPHLPLPRYKLGRHDEAKALFEEALAAYRGEFGEGHAMVARTLKNLGNVLKKQQNWGGALKAYSTANA